MDPETPHPPDLPPAAAKAAEVKAAAGADAAALTTAGQRRVNMLWESTQSLIALAVVLPAVSVSSYMAASGDTTGAAFLLLSNLANLVIGFYFGRTNHQRTGGVGTHDIGR